MNDASRPLSCCIRYLQVDRAHRNLTDNRGGYGVEAEHRLVTPPSRWLQLSEGRAVFELTAFLASAPVLRALGRGDGHPVLVLPGFTTSDVSTRPVRWILRSQGYWVHGWQLGRN